jgi:hypothetical protein
MGGYLPARIRTNADWPAAFAARERAHGNRTFSDIPESSDPIAAAILARDLAAEAADPFLGAPRRHVADESIGAEPALAFGVAAVCASAVATTRATWRDGSPAATSTPAAARPSKPGCSC